MPSPNPEELRALHDAQLRGHVPEMPPVGAVIQQDGPLVRTQVFEEAEHGQAALTAAESGPQRTAFTEFDADGRLLSLDAVVLAPESGTPADATAWAEHVPGTGFVVIEGIVDLERAGFQTITTATTYHWAPPSPPAAARPVRSLFRAALLARLATCRDRLIDAPRNAVYRPPCAYRSRTA
jgi:hypothetical protein